MSSNYEPEEIYRCGGLQALTRAVSVNMSNAKMAIERYERGDADFYETLGQVLEQLGAASRYHRAYLDKRGD